MYTQTLPVETKSKCPSYMQRGTKISLLPRQRHTPAGTYLLHSARFYCISILTHSYLHTYTPSLPWHTQTFTDILLLYICMCTHTDIITLIYTGAHAQTHSDCNRISAVTALIISSLCVTLATYCKSNFKFDYASITGRRAALRHSCTKG